MPIYMKAEGAAGDVTDKEHQGWMEILSCNFGIVRKDEETSSGELDSEDQHENSKVEKQSIIISKPSDSASATLIDWMVKGLTIPEIVVEAVKENSAWWYRYTFFKVRIMQFNLDGEEQDVPTENLTLDCETLRLDTVWVMPDNVTEGGESADWWATVPNPEHERGSFTEGS